MSSKLPCHLAAIYWNSKAWNYQISWDTASTSFIQSNGKVIVSLNKHNFQLFSLVSVLSFCICINLRGCSVSCSLQRHPQSPRLPVGKLFSLPIIFRKQRAKCDYVKQRRVSNTSHILITHTLRDSAHCIVFFISKKKRVYKLRVLEQNQKCL